MLTRRQAKLQRQAVSLHAGPPQPLDSSLNIPFLPIELIDLIVNYLSDKKQALKACCLVSRQWLSCARPRLHHTAILGSKQDVARWRHLFESCPAIRSYYLRRIEIISYESWLWASTQIKDYLQLGRLDRVESLKWDTPWVSGPRFRKAIDRFVKNLPSVKDLTVVGHFERLSDMVAFLSLFQGLRTLIIEGDGFDDLDASFWPDLKFNAGALEVLEMNYVDPASCNMVATWIIPRQLRRLRIYICEDGENADDIGKVITYSAETLRELVVESDALVETDFILPTIGDLVDRVIRPLVHQPLVNLREICFTVVVQDTYSFSNEFLWPPLIFPFMFMKHMHTAPSVNDVHFSLDFTADDGDFLAIVLKNGELWNSLVNEHVKRAFPNAQHIGIRIISNTSDGPRRAGEQFLETQISEFGLSLSITWEREWSEYDPDEGYIIDEMSEFII